MGKTVLFSAVVMHHTGASCTIAHRRELVDQISLALAKNGVEHRIIGPDEVIRTVVQSHMSELGKSFYNPNSSAAVASVDTLMSWNGTGVDGDIYTETRIDKSKWQYGPRENGRWGQPDLVESAQHGSLQGKRPPKDLSDRLRRYAPTVTLWITDEAHHLGAKGGKRNKWMRGVDLFDRARGLGVTATPCRADGAGLGRHHDGVFDEMVLGPTMRDLINDGYLTEYRIFAPPSDLSGRMGAVRISAETGDYNVNELREAVEQSSLLVSDDKTKKVVGDIVQTYISKFSGKLSVVFVPSVRASEELEQQFIKSGVRAKALDGTTPGDIRKKSILKFKNRELDVLINVALFDEGFDLPAIEVVQDAYPTNSYGLFCQRFGRMLRTLDGKKFGIYCDHAGNVLRHGLPDSKRVWTLDRRDKRSSSVDDVEPLRKCLNQGCYNVYEKYLTVCPFCETPVPKPTPSEREGPETVDGDLTELDAETLARMRGDIAVVDIPLNEAVAEYRLKLASNDAKPLHVAAHAKRFAVRHESQQTALAALREILAIWAGYHRAAGRSDSEIYRRFYLRYNIDWLSAQALKTDALLSLGERLAVDIGAM
jgi:superfamily II DNA or RNA helicase